MKISKREKVLLMILGIIIVIGCYYKFVYIQQNEMINQLNKEKSQDEQKIITIRNYASSIGKRESDIKILKAQIQNKTLDIVPDIKEEKIIVDLDNILNNSNLDGYSITFSDVSVQPISSKKQEQKQDVKDPLQDLVNQYNGKSIIHSSTNENNSDNKSNANKDKNSVSAEKMTVNINLKGSYINVINLIKNIENYSKKIIISNIKLAQDAKSGTSGIVTLDYYGIPKVTDEDKDFLKWEYNNKYGRDNPFEGISSTTSTGGTIEQIGKSNSESNYDFVMLVKPINSDLPTVMLGKSNDMTKSTYVYADNSGIENVEIYLTQKDSKYYYKYKTSRGTYPEQYNGDGSEFVPNGSDISFKIYSSKRISSEDVSGVNIKIYNKTDKQATFSIDNEDSTKPRVNVTGEAGNVDEKRN